MNPLSSFLSLSPSSESPTMKTLKALEELKAQRARVQEAITKSGPEIETARAEVAKAVRNLQEVEAAFLRGLSNEGAVVAAKAAVSSANESLADKQRAAKVADSVASQVHTEIWAAEVAHEAALMKRSNELIAPIKARLAGDKKTRAGLLEIFGLIAANSSRPGIVDWDSILSDCFPLPNDAEAAAAVTDGKKAVLS